MIFHTARRCSAPSMRGKPMGCGNGSISSCSRRPANGRGDRQPVGQNDRERRAARVRTLARRSTGASATSSPTPTGSWSAPRCTAPTSRIATARSACWLRSAISSPGCATSSPMAVMLAKSGRRGSPGWGSGRLPSSSDQIRSGHRLLPASSALGRRANRRLAWPATGQALRAIALSARICIG